MMKRLLIALAALSLFAGCAKNRDVELVRDGDKQNVLPKTAFIGANEDGSRGIWLTKMTIIDTSDAPAGTLFIGYQSDVQAGYFDFTEGQLQFRSLMGQLKGEESQNIKNNVLMNWNIEHIDYTLDESDGLTTNKEIEDNFKVWNQRRSFRIKWGEQKEIANQTNIFPISSFSVFECWSPVNIRRVDKTMKIEKDHIGFDVEVVYQRHPACGDSPQWAQSDFNFTATYKYSFRKLPETDYQPKAYTNEQDPARYKYGHFQTVRKVINPANGRPHNIFMENRWSEKTH
ncbi:MAG: hypothetical protein KDD33_01460, partial [Bdellovibrionales bacterium]|nr:hypothetical protein [Bdellovibrionales bacterium]